MTEAKLLSESEIIEIETLSAKVPDGPWFTASDDADDVPEHCRSGLALVETGRSADWWIARLCEWHIANFIAASKTNVDALCATVKALRVENEALKRRIENSNRNASLMSKQADAIRERSPEYDHRDRS